jgi:hypothetical protein
MAVDPGFPPKTNPAVCVPAPENWFLAVFKLLTSVQDDPSKLSVFTVVGGVSPPATINAV